MSVEFCDGLDTITTITHLNQRWDTVDTSTTYANVSTTLGRAGGTALTNGGGGNVTTLCAKQLPRPLAALGQDAVIYSASIYYISAPIARRLLLTLVNFLPPVSQNTQTPWSSTTSTSTWITVSYNTSGRLELLLNGTLLATGTNPMVAGEWKRIEIRVANIDDAGATAEVRVNGVTEISFTGDLFAAGSRQIEAIAYHFTNTHRGDDILVLSSGGSTMNGFLGDLIIDTQRPNGPGATTQSTPNTGTAWQAVDDIASDGQTTYTAIDTVGNKDTYAYSNMTTTPTTIHGVVVTTAAQSQGMSPRQFKTLSRLAGVEEEGLAQNVLLDLTANYRFSQDTFATKPGGGAWTRADVDAAEFGWKVTQ
ncbi:hypothetical protein PAPPERLAPAPP_05550 [Brevundimonas phage vB_BpoS-Papperlapapp]|uniref:Uncharacterized protein n=2 Tax=Marchewkavirus TaxID=3425052 RepID=A0A9E7MQE0_9CAUD|nr:hypothetical protein KABACHOK_03920 [Brevundimonas phage vB_BpoS-Kabachok]USN14920.1 hypothetical protein DOMOVOI_04490 [Brevundimonas phage vB_BpoS-Domovoi]USN16293.1 hypothetical protein PAPPERLAPAPP_05550 [Brevundimonas phage vB_BpoS-Papperlapapp]